MARRMGGRLVPGGTSGPAQRPAAFAGCTGQVDRRGGRGWFDAVAVHTHTACLVEPPGPFQRSAGRIGRFSFLGFRTVREVMVANGDGDRTIWMTELGWSTATSSCGRG